MTEMTCTRPESNTQATPLAVPTELLEKIIHELWTSELDRHERIDLWLSLTTTSHTLLSVFIRSAMRDVHILTPTFARYYLRLIRPRSSFEAHESAIVRLGCDVAHRLCRSLTFHVDARPNPHLVPPAEPAMRLYADGDRAAECVSNTLYLLSLVPVFVPGLRTVALHYTDWGFDDLFDQCRLLPLPAQVAHLELRFAFSPALQRLASRTRLRYGKGPHSPSGMRWDMRQIRHLAVRGAPPAFVSTVAQMCPELQTLDVDKHVEADSMWRLPASLATLVLLESKPSVPAHAVDWWRLARMIGGDLSHTSVDTVEPLLSAPWREYVDRQRLKRKCLSQRVVVRTA